VISLANFLIIMAGVGVIVFIAGLVAAAHNFSQDIITTTEIADHELDEIIDGSFTIRL